MVLEAQDNNSDNLCPKCGEILWGDFDCNCEEYKVSYINHNYTIWCKPVYPSDMYGKMAARIFAYWLNKNHPDDVLDKFIASVTTGKFTYQVIIQREFVATFTVKSI